MTAAFYSLSTSTVYRIVSDNATVVDLITDAKINCSSLLGPSTSQGPASFIETASDMPNPVQVIQYYRASSIALTLDGYNNSAVMAIEGTPDSPLPSEADTTLMECLNQTIGLAAPLIGGVGIRWTPPTTGLVGLAYVIWCLASWI